jgi:hypothetical protein
MNLERYNRMREWAALTGEDADIFRRKLKGFAGLNAATMDYADLNVMRYHLRMSTRLGVSAVQREKSELLARQALKITYFNTRGALVVPIRRT